MSKWINLEHQLPKPNEYQHFGKFVTVGEVQKGKFIDSLNGIYCDSYFYDSKVIVAWMPMPNAPKDI